MKQITFQVDDRDYDAIKAALNRREKMRWPKNGHSMPLRESDGPLDGRLLAEVCREWAAYKDRTENM